MGCILRPLRKGIDKGAAEVVMLNLTGFPGLIDESHWQSSALFGVESTAGLRGVTFGFVGQLMMNMQSIFGDVGTCMRLVMAVESMAGPISRIRNMSGLETT